MATQQSAIASTSKPRIKHLVLDAGPLLSLAPLRGIAENYYTTPQVVQELRDPRAREHFENLGVTAGVHVQVRQPDLLAVAQVTVTARKTGDYAVLSQADLCVVALTYALKMEEEGRAVPEGETLSTERNVEEGAPTDGSERQAVVDEQAEEEELEDEDEDDDEPHEEVDELQSGMENLHVDDDTQPSDEHGTTQPNLQSEDTEPPTDSDPTSSDGEGEWITPSNVSLHKSRARDLLPTAAGVEDKPMLAACMTADYAVQNVLLHMGLDLVSVDGKRITKVKSWVLRCHACFKICKDSSKKFCPSCGNPTLLRTSVSTEAPPPGSASQEPIFRVHLKPNFQYRTRGTIYSIPLPKPGQAKGGGSGGSGLILREDQPEYQRAVAKEKSRQAKEERVMARAVAAAARGERPRGEGTWDDPDWIPGIMLGENGRRRGAALPAVGHGRRNPNEARRKKR